MEQVPSLEAIKAARAWAIELSEVCSAETDAKRRMRAYADAMFAFDYADSLRKQRMQWARDRVASRRMAGASAY